jgi:hypothetical protein
MSVQCARGKCDCHICISERNPYTKGGTRIE